MTGWGQNPEVKANSKAQKFLSFRLDKMFIFQQLLIRRKIKDNAWLR